MTGKNVDTFILYCDNQGSMALAKSPVHHQRSKHIEIRYHFERDEVKIGSVELLYIPSDQNVADIFTKQINSVKTQKFMYLIMCINNVVFCLFCLSNRYHIDKYFLVGYTGVYNGCSCTQILFIFIVTI